MSELILMGNPRKRRSKKTRAKSRRRNPRRHVAKRRRHRNPVAAVTHRRHRRRNPIKYTMHRKKRRRNPIGSDAIGILTTGAYGAAGGLVLDFALAKLPLPAMFQTGPANYAAKAALAIGLGMLADKALGSRKGSEVANGTMAIVLHEVARDVITTVSPTLGASLGDLQYSAGHPAYLSPAPIVGRIAPPGMGSLQYDPLSAATAGGAGY